jgi:anti-sigma factor RsiW
MDCAKFIESYSEYRDGLLAEREQGMLREHADGCARCARYDRVISGGVGILQALPRPEVSDDFMPRLQYRLFALEERRRRLRAYARRASVAGVFVFAGIGGLAVGTHLRPASPVYELPPVAAQAPRGAPELPLLFRTGPLLTPRVGGQTASWQGADDLFFQYSAVRGGRAAAVQAFSVE